MRPVRKSSSKSDPAPCTSSSGVLGQDTPPEPEHLISGLFDSPGVGIAVCDKRFRFKAINPALAAMNGVPVEAHLDKTIYEVLGNLAERIQYAFDEVLQTGKPVSNFGLIGKPESRPDPSQWIENFFPIKDRFGKVKEVGAIVIEVRTQPSKSAHLRHLSAGLRQSIGQCQFPWDAIALSNPLLVNIAPELFRDLDHMAVDKLLKLARRCTKQHGDTFCRQGEQAHHVYLLLKGLVKVGGITHAGKEVLLDWMQPGESFGLGAVLSPPAENVWTVSSVANTEAFEWDTATISRLAESCPVFHKNALRIALRWTQQLQKRFESLSTKTVEQRVADSVCFLAERFRSHTPAEVRLSDEELAQMTGTNLFTVNKILRGWQRLGHVNKSRKRLIILDCESLRRISGSSVER
jgi:CRP-like cAMP-binding protein